MRGQRDGALWLALLALSACQPLDDNPRAVKSALQLAAMAEKDESIGGMKVRSFFTVAGQPAPFRDLEFEPGAPAADATGPATLPAFAEGGPSAFFVTDVWQSAAAPVVQPAYMLVSRLDPAAPASQRLRDADGQVLPIVFGVGPFSPFASPYWEIWYAIPKDASAVGRETATDVRRLLAVTEETVAGPNVGCPFVPAELLYSGERARRPLSLEAVKSVGSAEAWVDGHLFRYGDLGPNKFRVADDGHVVATRLYTFVTPSSPAPVELPAVLAADARANTLAERVDVVLTPEDFEVFVPPGAQWSALRKRLTDQGLTAPELTGTIAENVEKPLRLKVARRPDRQTRCFADLAALPGPCTWLDSEAAISALRPTQRVASGVRLSVWPTLFNGAIP